jgi:signal transduction histidine kinase
MSEAAELGLFRALQEGLANVVRHAGASTVDVTVHGQDGAVELEVADDGQGLPDGMTAEQFERNGHMGLAGMRERIGALGGSVTLHAAPAGGVRLRVRVPTGGEDRA